MSFADVAKKKKGAKPADDKNPMPAKGKGSDDSKGGKGGFKAAVKNAKKKCGKKC